jgi:hypothetical protein
MMKRLAQKAGHYHLWLKTVNANETMSPIFWMFCKLALKELPKEQHQEGSNWQQHCWSESVITKATQCLKELHSLGCVDLVMLFSKVYNIQMHPFLCKRTVIALLRNKGTEGRFLCIQCSNNNLHLMTLGEKVTVSAISGRDGNKVIHFWKRDLS